MSDEPIIVAHRGLHLGTGLPENSIAAIVAAWRSGIGWCECDVHYSADGVPYVLHDPTLDRTTSGTGLIAEKHSRELAGLTLRNRAGGLTDHPLPKLEELMAAMPSDCGLFIEIKPETQLAVQTATRWAGDRVQYLTFPAGTVRALVEGGFGQVTWTGIENDFQRESMWSFKTRGLQIRHDWVNADLAREAKSRGMQIGVWVVDHVTDMKRLVELGVRHVTSDEPIALRAAWQSLVRSHGTPGEGQEQVDFE